MRRPHVMINMAMSADGKVSTSQREPVTFTSREDKRHLMRIRARCDALVVAASTAADYKTMGISDPKLRAQRLRRKQTEHPIRVIISGRLHLSENLPVFRSRISPLLIICTSLTSAARRKHFSQYGRVLVCGDKEVNIPNLIDLLVCDYGVRSILCEGGPTLNEAFFRHGKVDDLYVTICPRLVGGKNAPTLVDGKGFSKLRESVQGKLISCRKGIEEWFLHYHFSNKKVRALEKAQIL